MSNETVREKLIAAGVRNLNEFGYQHASAANILTDMIYSQFFASMLRDNLGNGFDAEINELLKAIPSMGDDCD
jgi:hypothetical protein